MRITKVAEDIIQFDNGSVITFDHYADCCEYNYADFKQLDDLARNYEFDEKLEFEAVDGSGFRFGSKGRTFFVPCYSEQNGYYSSDVDIYFNGEQVLTFECESVDR